MKNLTATILIIFSQVILFGQCPPGDLLIFSSQTQIDEFKIQYPNCTDYQGGITITGGTITNLYGLSELVSIGNDLNFLYTVNLHNMMGMSSLETIGGMLNITENYTLTSLGGLSTLNRIDGDVIIYKNAYLNSVSGLSGLASVGGSFIISQSTINTLSGMTNLVSVGNVFEIIENPELTSLEGLSGLEEVGGTLSIQNNESLANLNGLENLQSTGGGLMIRSNIALTDLMALEALTSIGGELTIQSNYALTSLSGIDNIESGSIYDLTIYSNTSLSTCEVLSICEYLVSPGGGITIANNDTGCDDQQEVEQACEWVSVDEFNELEQIEIYPNPANSIVTLEHYNSLSVNALLTISNANGQEVVRRNISEAKTEIDISSIQAGIYIIRLQTDKGTAVQKLVVN